MDIGEGFSRIQVSREKPVLESIEITTPPTKTEYTAGELFDKAGMVVTAKYNNGSSKVVTEYTYLPNIELKTTDSTVTIVYTENNVSKEATQNITVVNKEETTDNDKDNNVTLKSIEITTPPTKTNYTVGELFNNTGMVVTAKYSDGSSKIVTDYTYLPKIGLKTTDSIVTIVYTENNISKEATQNIKVTKASSQNIISNETTQNTVTANKNDTTIAKGILPNTGRKVGTTFVMIATIGMVVGLYLKNRKMKDII